MTGGATFRTGKVCGGQSVAFAAVVAILSLARVSAAGQTVGTKGGCPEDPAGFHPCALARAKAFNPPRTPDGKPDLQGFWIVNGSLSNIEEHPRSTPDVLAGGDRGGQSLIVEPADGKIPYQPWALAQRQKNVEHYIAPLAQCVLPGVPRQVHSPGGFQILQFPDYVVVLTEYVHSFRIIPLDGHPHVGEPIRLLQGDSRGHWEGNTLVVDVTNVDARIWFDWVDIELTRGSSPRSEPVHAPRAVTSPARTQADLRRPQPLLCYVSR